MSQKEPLTDRFGRVHTYLRVSATDRCNYRCVYCMPPEGLHWLPRSELLTYEEIGKLVGVFASMGIQKVRITGGEPTARADIESLIAAVAGQAGINDVAMTTNGHTLAALAPRLAQAGLKRVNVSLDSLQADRFSALTRGGQLSRVLDGIAAAREAGITPIKINAVMLAGQNDDELFNLVRYFGQWSENTELRFIEYMPFEIRQHRTVPSRTLRKRLSEQYTLRSNPQGPHEGPARTWTLLETGLRVGFISPLSEHFCATCNRLRLLADGQLRTCLAHEENPSLRDLLRQGASRETLECTLRAIVMGKPVGHDCDVETGTPFQGVMTRVGG